MKQLTVLLVFLLVTANIFAQDISQNNVPAVVLNAFQLKYGNASDVEWRLEKGNYRVIRLQKMDKRPLKLILKLTTKTMIFG